MIKGNVEININELTKRGVVYGRVSTNNETQKSSLKYQTEMFDDYAIRNNIEIINVYAEVGSGTSIIKRKEFKQLLQDARLGLFDCILTKDVSRWSRDNLGFLETIRELKKLGIIVYFVDIGLNSEDDEMTLSILAAVAQKEALNTRAKTKSVRRYQIENGAVPSNIYGYNKPKGTGAYTLEINEEEANVVRLIFDLYAKGTGSLEICRILKDAGIKAKRDTWFDLQNILKIIRNKIFIGVVQNNKEESKDKVVEREVIVKDKSEWLEHDRPDLRIVSNEVFYKCQEIVDAKSLQYRGHDRIRTGWNLPLTKVLVCADCGTTFKRCINGKYSYFKCGTRLVPSHNACGNNVTIREDDIFNEIKVYLISLLNKRADVEKLIEQRLLEKLTSTSIKTRLPVQIESELDEKKKKKMRAMELYINEGNTDIKPIIDTLTKEISGLEAELAKKLNSPEYNLEIYKGKIADLFSNMEEFINSVEIRELNGEKFNQLFESIKVHGDGHLTITLALFGVKKTLHSVGLDEGGVRPKCLYFEVGDVRSLAVEIFKQNWTSFKNCRTVQLGSTIHDEICIAI